MKFTRRVLLLLFLFTTPILTFSRDMSKKENIDVKEILWGHIKDSYEWHITDLGTEGNIHPVVIHLPIIVKTSTGWHIFSSGMFAEERDANGDRPGPYNLVIKSGDDKVNPNLIVEKIGNKEVRPIDLSITKVVCTVFIDGILLLLVILIPAHWCRKHVHYEYI